MSHGFSLKKMISSYIMCIVSLMLIDAIRKLKIENQVCFCIPDNSSYLRTLRVPAKGW